MPERDPIERLHEALEGLTVENQAVPDRDIRALLFLARRLQRMPREAFRADLKAQLEEKAMTMRAETTALPLREGVHSLTPCFFVAGAAQFMEFLKEAFGAAAELRVPTPEGSPVKYAEVRIGDSRIEIGDSSERYPGSPSAIHLYVPDTDSVYQRALDAGATSLHAVEEMPYGERSGSVKDPFGNHWYIATAHGASHIPEGLRTVNPYLHPAAADRLLDFLKQAFGAEDVELYREQANGPIRHAKMRLGDTILEMGEAHGQYRPLTAALHYYVPDVDAAYQRALEAGATSISAPVDRPHGERGAGIKDPAGNTWFLATALSGSSR